MEDSSYKIASCPERHRGVTNKSSDDGCCGWDQLRIIVIFCRIFSIKQRLVWGKVGQMADDARANVKCVCVRYVLLSQI